MSDGDFLSKSSIKEKAYSDEPIIRRASQLQSFVPDKIREMRKLGEDYSSVSWSHSRLFYRQARFMEDYTDNYEYHGIFMRFYPTYQLLNDSQLRGYFSWRTKLRNGNLTSAPLTFAVLYCYELINGIGEETPQDCWRALKNFRDGYALIDSSIRSYVNVWLCDLAVYYSLGEEERNYVAAAEGYSEYRILANSEKHADEELLGALLKLSLYDAEYSPVVRDRRELFGDVLLYVYRAMADKYKKRTGKKYTEMLFGGFSLVPYEMFSLAVFCDRAEKKDRTVRICGDFFFVCKGGKWYVSRLAKPPVNNKKLGDLLKSVDAVLRTEYGYDAPSYAVKIPPQTEKLVKTRLAELKAEEERRKAAEIRIDMSKLSGIRADAFVTQERLMTEDERAEFPAEEELMPRKTEEAVPEKEAAPEEDEKTGSVSGELSILDPDELFTLKSVLAGKDCSEELKKHAKFMSVVADSVNEKLFDLFCDTVILFDGDRPYVPEEYAEEITELVLSLKS